MFTPEQHTFLCDLIDGKVPFLLCAFPEEDHLTLYGDAALKGDIPFAAFAAADIEIVDFDGTIHRLDSPGAPIPSATPDSHTTTCTQYQTAFATIMEHLRERGGKTVLSRVIAGTTTKRPSEIAEAYFAKFADTFRFIYQTRATGLWIGASPELLADNNTRRGTLHTGALAGTRRAETSSRPWDAKNREEHQLVVRFICDSLQRHGLTPTEGEYRNVRFGEIEHLHTPITARATADIHNLLHTLSPSPALSGYPRDESLALISRTELHSRKCYGGYIAVSRHGRTRAYVNLRSAHLSSDSSQPTVYSVYVGGGLTAASHLRAEWEETECKARALLKILDGATD